MYKETADIIVQVSRRLPATGAEAMAMYASRKVETHEELINLAHLICFELAKINGYLDETIARMEATHQEELGRLAEMD